MFVNELKIHFSNLFDVWMNISKVKGQYFFYPNKWGNRLVVSSLHEGLTQPESLKVDIGEPQTIPLSLNFCHLGHSWKLKCTPDYFVQLVWGGLFYIECLDIPLNFLRIPIKRFTSNFNFVTNTIVNISYNCQITM